MYYKTLLLLGSLFGALFVLGASDNDQAYMSTSERPTLVSHHDPASLDKIKKRPKIKEKSKTPSECIDRVKEQQRDIADNLIDIKKMLVKHKDNKKEN